MQLYQRFQHIGHTDFNTSGTNGPRSLLRMKVGTHSPSPTGSHTADHRAKQGAFRMGGGISTLGAFHTFRKPCVARYQNGVLCRFGILAGRCSRRTQKAFGTAMRLCVSLFRRRRGPAGLRDFFVSVEIYGLTPRTQGFLCVRGGGGITTPGARCVLPKFSAPACQSGLFAVF